MSVILKSLLLLEELVIDWRNKMLKNREFNKYLILSLLIILISIILINYLSTLWIALIVCAVEGLLLLIFIWYTKKRYQNITLLNEYLMKVYTGGDVMDIRDNREGELSVLKNDLYKVTRTLREQSIQLQREKTFLADTLSNISHQLKTPLTSMMLMNDVMMDENLPNDKKQEFMRMMHHQLERMQWLVSSLLTLSKIDANAIVFKEEKIDARKLIDHAIESQLIPMELRQQQLIIECDKDCFIKGDFKWLSESLVNIIKNCVEHTQMGGIIKIICSATALFIKITIQDNGEGMDKEELSHIFERFYKGNSSSKDSVGIGLAMAKAFIINNDGKIDVVSTKQKGTTFTIELQKYND